MTWVKIRSDQGVQRRREAVGIFKASWSAILRIVTSGLCMVGSVILPVVSVVVDVSRPLSAASAACFVFKFLVVTLH